jgi:hypothetical protein
VTIGKGVQIHQPDNNAKITVNQSLNVSSLQTFSDTTTFGGVNFSIINPAGDPVDVFLSYFDEDAVEPEYVANYSANTDNGISNLVTFQFDGLAENSLYKASMNGDMFESGETGSNGNFSFTTGRFPSLQDFSVQNFDNLAPSLGKPFYREDRKQGIQRLVFGVDDRGEDDIDSLSGPGTSVVSSNSVLGVSVDLPVSGVYNVSDIYGAVSNNRSVELSKIDSGLREHDYGHTLDVQRLNRTVELVNDDDEDLDYNLTLENHGSTVVQGGSWSGSIPGSGSVVNTVIWEDDYIVDEIVDMVQKGPDGGFDHLVN